MDPPQHHFFAFKQFKQWFYPEKHGKTNVVFPGQVFQMDFIPHVLWVLDLMQVDPREVFSEGTTGERRFLERR